MGKNKFLTYSCIWITSVSITWLIAASYYKTDSETIDSKEKSKTKSHHSNKAQTSNSGTLRFDQKQSNRRISVKAQSLKVDSKKLLEPLINEIDFNSEEFIIRNVRKITLFLENCNENELASIIRDNKDKNGENWNILKMLAFSKLAENQAETALKLSQEIEFEQRMLRPEIIDSWSREKPLEALTYLKNSSEDEDWSYCTVFKNLSKRSYQEAVFELSKVNELNKAFALQGIAQTLNSPAEFSDLLTYPSKENSEETTMVLGEWAKKSPIEALQWCEVQDQEQQAKFSEAVKSTWLYMEPEKAAEWMVKNNEGQSDVLDQIVTFWNSEKTEKLQDFLGKQPYSLGRDSAYLNFIKNNYSHDSTHTLNEIKSPTLRKEAVKTIYTQLFNYEDENAELFLNDNKDLSQEEKEQLRKDAKNQEETLDLFD